MLENKKSFAIVREIIGFEIDGVLVIPKKWMRNTRNGKYEKCANEILRFRKVDNVATPKWYLGLNTLEEIFAYLNKEDIWPAVEVFYKNDPFLYIGQITEASKNTFKICCYDATGKWEKEYELEFKKIFKIEINSSYVRHFNDFMRAKKPRTAKLGIE